MICSLCSASVDSRAELELHLRRELRYRGFECGICGLLFYSEADALYHFRSPLSTHSGHRPEIVANPKPQLDARIAALLDSSTHSSDTDASPPTPLHSPSDSEDRPPSAVTTSAGSPVPFLMEDVSEAELPKLEESSDEEEQEEIDNVNMSLSHNQDTAKAKTPKRMTTPEEKEKLIAALEAGATGTEEARRLAKELDWPAIKVQRWFYKNKGGVTITKKGPNLGFSEEVKKAFNELYNVCPKPNLEQRLRLCKELGLNDKQVYNWFNSKNRYKKS